MRVPKQEQEPASEDVTEVAPGVLRLQLPISLPGLGHVNTYALEDDRGVALVDPGLPGRRSQVALRRRLAGAGLSVRRVHTVVVTHSHPDHYGGAPALARAGASVVAHEDFGPWWHRSAEDGGGAGDGEDGGGDGPARRPGAPPWQQPTPWGGPSFRPSLRRRLGYRVLGPLVGGRWRPPRPDRAVAAGDGLELGRRRFVVRHTPGHTLDHICLHDPEAGVLLSGDHVLPTITPHISGLGTGPDPLAAYLGSLAATAALPGVDVVLPAHGHPFDDLAGRVAAIAAHHDGRLDALRAATGLGWAPVPAFSEALFRPERRGPMADSESYAHLEHLRHRGEAARRRVDGALEYRIQAEAGAPEA